MTKVRWGVLGAARIALRKVIPAMQASEWSEIAAIASRDRAKAEAAAQELGIPKVYGSYEELIHDPDIEAIYNPLPNHLHVPWTVRAMEAGIHVLCEKPVGRDEAEAQLLLDARDRTGMLCQEAFVVRVNPQWLKVVEIARSGRIGEVRAISGVFSYHNDDPQNVRNVAEYGGGALLDIGCYLINVARMIFGREPARVVSSIERDARFGVDVLTSFMLDFAPGHCTAMCSMQLVHSQRVQVFGTRGRVELEIPFNAPPDRPARVFVDDGSDLYGGGREVIELPICNQYTVQGDGFSKAVRGVAPLDYPLEDSILNMRVIDAVFQSADSGMWVALG